MNLFIPSTRPRDSVAPPPPRDPSLKVDHSRLNGFDRIFMKVLDFPTQEEWHVSGNLLESVFQMVLIDSS